MAGLTVKVHITGAKETLRAFNKLPKDANKKLREASLEIARLFAARAQAAAASAPTPQASMVKVKARYDRVPSVQASDAVGILFGSEFGSNRFRQFHHRHTGRAGIWFFPLIEREAPMIDRLWNKAADDIARSFSAGGL